MDFGAAASATRFRAAPIKPLDWPDQETGLIWAASVLIGLALGLALLALVTSVRLRRQVRQLRRDQQQQANSILALHGAMKAISEDVINHGQMQSSVRRTLEHLAEQQNEMRLRDTDEGPYAQAIQLIRDGRGREEVRKLCGLTQAELELLFSLHGQGVNPGLEPIRPSHVRGSSRASPSARRSWE